ncbi:MAG TPA: hypothetical protein VLE69_01810 [Candidatus Saccharimonadales bacterium]|nr:hypothetical protein [Candidatus Saccharimonadales bacterium]
MNTEVHETDTRTFLTREALASIWTEIALDPVLPISVLKMRAIRGMGFHSVHDFEFRTTSQERQEVFHVMQDEAGVLLFNDDGTAKRGVEA